MNQRREKLKALLSSKDWTPERVKDATGASVSTIYRWLNGESHPQGKHADSLDALLASVPDAAAGGENERTRLTRRITSALDDLTIDDLRQMHMQVKQRQAAALVAEHADSLRAMGYEIEPPSGTVAGRIGTDEHTPGERRPAAGGKRSVTKRAARETGRSTD